MPSRFSGKILRKAIIQCRSSFIQFACIRVAPLDLSRDVTSPWGATLMQEKWIKLDLNTMYVDLNEKICLCRGGERKELSLND